MSVPQTTKKWTVTGNNSFDDLKFHADAKIPPLGDQEVLVKIQGASLNYRDLIIPLGQYPFGNAPNVVPGSDGAGTVVATGSQVTRFQPGDRVLTLFNQGHRGGALDPTSLYTGLGGQLDGTFRQYGAFDEDGLVRMPSNLDFPAASTLVCAGLTAWNALFGLEGRKLLPGQWVVTQGTGGVSLFAVQFAKMAGARVVATTGDESKAATLRQLGADHVLNYKTTPNWGEEAKKLTPGGAGVDHVIEVAGPSSMRQSLAAIRIDGVISIIGFLGGTETGGKEPGFLECLTNLAVVRGILVGSRVQLEEMCRAVEAWGDKMQPVMDEKVFTLDQLKEAYEYMWSQKHMGNVCLKID